MEVKFQTKDESKRKQQEEFLKLSGGERFMKFLELSRAINQLLPIKNKLSFEERYEGDFLIVDEHIAYIKHNKSIENFIKLANKYEVKMILVGGGAVNIYGYERSSADINFWIDTSNDNMNKLVQVFDQMGFAIERFPQKVIDQEQNISIKFSPIDLDLELITNFSVNKTFDEAYNESEEEIIKDQKLLKWKVLNYENLKTSKIKSNRPKDLLDVQQLEEIRKNQ